MSAKVAVPTESQEQQALFHWARLSTGKHPELRWMFHVPNEGARHPATGRRMRAEGLKRGVPDICLPVARNGLHGLYIELKRVKGGRATDEQKEWIEYLKSAGYAAYICKGWEEAAATIKRYLES